MATRADRKHWTYSDLCAIPSDHNRYEIIDGQLLVAPSPSYNHQEIAAQLSDRLRAYLKIHRIGNAVSAPADVRFSDDTVVEPDVFVVPLVDGKLPTDWKPVRRLLLVIEVLSPRTARVDRTLKRRRYQSEGVPEYWIVDGLTRSVERWLPEDSVGATFSDRIEWHPAIQVPPLVIDLVQLFGDAAEAFDD